MHYKKQIKILNLFDKGHNSIEQLCKLTHYDKKKIIEIVKNLKNLGLIKQQSDFSHSISIKGKEALAQYHNERNYKFFNEIRAWITFVIAVTGFVLSIIRNFSQ